MQLPEEFAHLSLAESTFDGLPISRLLSALSVLRVALVILVVLADD